MSNEEKSSPSQIASVSEASVLSAQSVTTKATEADLEARIDSSIRKAFPLLPREAIHHQTTFSFQFGGNTITIDGRDKTKAHARADVILYLNDKPLAVLELKKSGLALSEEDSQQGLSYARVLNPSPPLVVISNGEDIRFLETYTGNEWTPDEISEISIKGLLTSAAKVAAGDLKMAISTLMATNPEVWVQAIRKTTEAKIAELSGDWDNRLLPFVHGFEIPRKATMEVITILRNGSKLVIVDGAPLVGKSNVLRELVHKTEKDSSLVVLFVESDGSESILRHIADTLAQALNWPVTKEDARTWLKDLSYADGPKLVVAIDGIGLNLSVSREEIVDLTSHVFGAKIAFVVELDDNNADVAVINSTGRKSSAIGRRATRVNVKPLDAEEFDAASRSLLQHRLEMTNGAQSSEELRLPWVLRAIGSQVLNQPQHRDLKLSAMIPPLLSVDLIRLTREAFDAEIRISFQAIALAALKDAKDAKRPISLMLESMSAYVIREKTLKKKLTDSELSRLVEQGYLRRTLHESNEVVFVARIPELVAAEVSVILAQKLCTKARNSAEDASKWLSNIAHKLPFGDIVAAQALIDAARQDQGISFEVIIALMNHPPKEEPAMEIGQRFAMRFQDIGTLFLTICPEGFSARSTHGDEHFIPFEPDDDLGVLYADVHPWLILSHLAMIPLEVVGEQETVAFGRVDPAILMEVAKCPIILRRPSAKSALNAILTHEIKGHGVIVCHKSGIVEPITLALLRFLAHETTKATEWIIKAISSGSFPMLCRLYIALQELNKDADEEISTFANDTLIHCVQPAFSKFPILH